MEHNALTCEQLIDGLDRYLDGDGDAVARAAADGHLAACPGCAGLAADVRALRRMARTLGAIEPPASVWPRVRARVAMEAAERGSWLSRPGLRSSEWWAGFQTAGATAALVIALSSLAWLGERLAQSPPTAPVAGDGRTFVAFELAEAEYREAIASLEEAAAAAAPRLDALTTATLRSSIDDIDLAIGEAREALAQEPGDPLSQESLLDALGSKVVVLQDTVAMLGALEPAAEELNP